MIPVDDAAPKKRRKRKQADFYDVEQVKKHQANIRNRYLRKAREQKVPDVPCKKCGCTYWKPDDGWFSCFNCSSYGYFEGDTFVQL